MPSVASWPELLSINIVLNVIFIHFWGVLGAALATTLVTTLRSAALGVLVWKRLRILPTVFSWFLPTAVTSGGPDAS